MWRKRISVAVIFLMGTLVVTVLFPWIQNQRELARRTQSRNNLKQIGFGLFNYMDSHNGLPPGGVFNDSGEGFHGWMVFIHPFLEGSPFYNHVNFNLPWNTDSNAGLLLNPYVVYENPDEPAERGHWKFPVAHYCANAHLFAANSFVRLESVEEIDRVFLAGELDGGFVPWGCPYNWRELDAINSTPATFGRSTKDGCHFLFADGHVEFVANAVSRDLIQRMSGDDLSGFHANQFDVRIPSTFPCPTDALQWTWTYRDGQRIETKRDIHGNVVWEKAYRGK